MKSRFPLGLILICTSITSLAVAQSASPRASLIQADNAASQAVLRGGMASGLSPVLDDSVVLLYAGAPPVAGKGRVTQLLNAQPALRTLRVQWFPTVVAISEDGRFGVTSGATIVAASDLPTDSTPSYGHYITVWRRSGEGPWTIIALLPNGVNHPDSVVIPAAIRTNPGSVAISAAARPFADADLEFARLAADSGAPMAFGVWAAPDVTTPPGDGIMAIGPAQLRARIGGGPAGKLPWQWHPIWGVASASGDLAATIGLSTIGTGDQAYIGKYISIWRRQPDGSIRFILDSGNDRPR